MGRHRNPEQSKILVEFMQLHKDIALGRVARRDRDNYEILWTSLTEDLNAKGPPMKTSGEWKKVWTDWKKACQKKLTQPEDGSRSITDQEQIIIKMCDWTVRTIKEYESDEDSNGSSTSSDTPLKLAAAVSNENLHVDPLTQENLELQELSTSELQLTNNEGINEQNRGRHRNSEQSKILLDFMLLHKDIANGCTRDRENKETKNLWKELCNELNVWGPPVKSIRAWKKAWTDWRIACRRKLALQKLVGAQSGVTRQEQSIIELCGLEASHQNDYDCNEDSDRSSISLNTPLKTNDMSKKRKLKEESLSDVENTEIAFLSESQVESIEMPQATVTEFTEIERSLAGVRAGVATIQTSLQELCKLIAEQNQEMKRFFADSRRHHFVMEKEMIERKRERMK